MPINKEKSDLKTILLIGSTGKGKSTLANVLINKNNNFEEIFKESEKSTSGTREIQKEEFIESGINYVTIDTVGIGDTRLKKEEVLDKLAEAVYLARNGISQIFFVIGVKFDEKEMANYNLLKAIIFDQEVVKHTTIVRTRFEKFEESKECEKDIELMTKEDNKVSELAEIIKSCQKRVVHVDNPSLNLVPDDDEDEKEEKIRIEKEIRNRKGTRSASRKKVLEHLKQVCQEEPYQPSKLKALSTEIFAYMEERIQKRKELEEKERTRKASEKSEEETKKKEEDEAINKQSSATEDSENESEKSSKKGNKLKLIKTWIKSPSLKKGFRKKRKRNRK